MNLAQQLKEQDAAYCAHVFIKQLLATDLASSIEIQAHLLVVDEQTYRFEDAQELAEILNQILRTQNEMMKKVLSAAGAASMRGEPITGLDFKEKRVHFRDGTSKKCKDFLEMLKVVF